MVWKVARRLPRPKPSPRPLMFYRELEPHQYIQVQFWTKYVNVTGPLCREFNNDRWISSQRPVTRSFDVVFDLRLNKCLSKQQWSGWFETPSHSLWRHCDGKIWIYCAFRTDSIYYNDSRFITLHAYVLGTISRTVFHRKWIRWEINSALIKIMMKWSIWYFAPDSLAWLSWHLQIFVALWYPTLELCWLQLVIVFESKSKRTIHKMGAKSIWLTCCLATYMCRDLCLWYNDMKSVVLYGTPRVASLQHLL